MTFLANNLTDSTEVKTAQTEAKDLELLIVLVNHKNDFHTLLKYLISLL